MFTRRRVLGVAVSGCVLLGGLAVLVWLDRHPLTSRALPAEAERAGEVPRGVDGTDVMLAVDSRVIAESAKARSFARLDLSFGWLGPLQAEFGPVAIVDLAAGDAASAASAKLRIPRALIVSSSAHASAAALAQRVVAAGGTVLVDAPDGDAGREIDAAWLVPAGLAPGTPRTAPFPRSGVLPAASLGAVDRDAFDAAPLPRPASIRRLDPVDGGTTPLSSATPSLFFARAVGTGRVIVATASLGRWFATMLQGQPNDDFSVSERHGDYADIVEPDDLVADPRLRENETPFADLLAHAVASLLDPPSGPPIPRLLWFPAGSRGVFLMTHDEDLRGGAAMRKLAEWDQAHGIRGTHFVVGHPRIEDGPSDWPWAAGYSREIERLDGQLAIHWNQMPTPRGLWKIEPAQWVATLAEQESWFRQVARHSDDPAWTINRNHFLILRPHWSSTFRIMAAAGIALDSTLAANKGRGYLLGTARPYPLLDANGLPLPVLELPFQSQEDWGGADAAYFSRLLEANAQRHHGAIVSIFHPPSVLRAPTDPALIEHVARTALATGHGSRTMSDLLDFWRERAAARVASEATADGALALEIAGTNENLAIGLPLRDGEHVAAATRGGDALALESVAINGRNYAVIALPPGAAEIDVRFTRD